MTRLQQQRNIMADSQQLLLRYYSMKRTALFFDEHIFYVWLFILYYNAYTYMMVGVMLWGLICLYTGYRNIGALEKLVEPRANQRTWWFLSDN